MNPAAARADAGSRVSEAGPDAEIGLGILSSFVGMWMRVAYESAYRDFEAELGPDALRPGYFTILTLIALNPDITQTQLARASRRDKSSVAKALRFMEDEGLVARTRLDEDRRARRSRLTAEGAALQSRMESKARVHLARLTEAIGPDRRDMFLETLRDVTAQLTS